MARPRELPLGRDPSSRFLPWILGVMVYLAVLAVIGGLATDRLTGRWISELEGRLTIEIPPADSGAGDDVTSADRVALALRILQLTPGIEAARAIDREEAAKLLQPWLDPALVDDLPLPILIDVVLDGQGRLDIAKLAGHLARAIPEVKLNDHRRWTKDLAATARAAALVGLVVVVLVGAAAVLSVVFAVRTGLAMHRDLIELLHLIGAHDGYIARQFQWHVLRLAFAGSLAGAALAFASVAAAAAALSGGSLLDPWKIVVWVGFGPTQWLVLAVVPVAAAVLSAISARLSVLRALAAMA